MMCKARDETGGTARDRLDTVNRANRRINRVHMDHLRIGFRCNKGSLS